MVFKLRGPKYNIAFRLITNSKQLAANVCVSLLVLQPLDTYRLTSNPIRTTETGRCCVLRVCGLHGWIHIACVKKNCVHPCVSV